MLKEFTKVEINWVRRSANKVADKLISLALNLGCNFTFEMDYPSEIHSLVISDSSK